MFFCHRRKIFTSQNLITNIDEFRVTRLGLANMGGYEYAAGALYMQACHNLAPGRWNEKQVPRMGYREARGRQDRYPTLAQALAAVR